MRMSSHTLMIDKGSILNHPLPEQMENAQYVKSTLKMNVIS